MKAFYVLLVAIVCYSCAEKPLEEHFLQGDAFGTTYSIRFFTSERFDAEKGMDSVIHAVNKSVSTYMPNSDISKINRGDSSIVIDPIFREVYSISEAVYKNSNGYFDPTIGVLRNAYGFGDTKAINSIDGKTLDSLMTFVGFSKVSLTDKGTIHKDNPNIYFDFNAVAKGYGIDCIGRFLAANKVENYLIELGGELLSSGRNVIKEQAWVVGIESIHSDLENREYEATIRLEDKGMASSGNYRKFRVDSITGKKYVHTLNPLSGSAEQSDVTSATVVTKTCAEADAYATAFMAMGLERSKVLLSKQPEIDAYLTYTDSENKEQLYVSEGFKSLLIQ